MSVSSETRRYFTDSPAIGGWGLIAQHGNGIYAPSLNANGNTNPAYLPGGQYGLNCAPTGGCTKSQTFPVSAELAALLDSRPNPEADWSFNYGMDFGDFGAPGNLYRSIFSETRTNQASFGLKGEIEAIDGTWDVIVSQGTAKLDLRLEGYASLTRVRTVLGSPNFGYGFFAQGNSAPPGNGFSGGIATCTSGVPVFGRSHGAISQDCLDAMYVTLNHQSEMEQKFVEGNVQGHAFDLWAGEARFSAGVHSRSNSYYYIFDPLQTGNSFNDNPEGFPADNTKGETAVDEIYGELLVPLLNGKTGAEHLNLELGYRYSDYDLQGGIDTYKALVDWGITDTLRFRGGRQLATRAPNIAELFQAKTQSWSVQVQGEPCALNSQVAYGANPARNPQAASAQALCSAIIGSVAGTYYSPAQQAQINPVVWLPFVDATGNPKVNPEEAKTLTAGFVWSPNTQYEWVNGLNLTVDYYDIKITDMISVEGAYTVYEKCLSPSSNPTFSAQHPECLKINRNPETRHRNDDDRVVRQRGVRGSGGCRSHGGLAHGSRGRHVRRELHDLAATGRDDAGHGAGRADRLEGQPRSHRQHVAEQRRLRLSNVHDVQLWDRRLERVAALAAFAVGDRCFSGGHQLQHRGRPASAHHGRLAVARCRELVRRVRSCGHVRSRPADELALRRGQSVRRGAGLHGRANRR